MRITTFQAIEITERVAKTLLNCCCFGDDGQIGGVERLHLLREGSMSYQLVGRVKAYQGKDG